MENREVKCKKCHKEIDPNINFCPNCGQHTIKGYNYLKNNTHLVTNNKQYKRKKRSNVLLIIFVLLFISYTIMIIFKNENILRPYAFFKKDILSKINGHNSSTLKNDNLYYNEKINNKEEAISFLIKDIESQEWQCSTNVDVGHLEYTLEHDYNIKIVSFCDMDTSEAEKITNVIKKIYALFPSIKGALTNISISNFNQKEDFVAYFQPMYEFVNSNQDISEFNKINKTQILLNSYYFLNNDILNDSISKIVPNNWYVKDATWQSTIAHELGHYISFYTLLKEEGLEDIIFVTKENIEKINKLLEKYDNNSHSLKIVNEALLNYQNKYNITISKEDYAKLISKYAASKTIKNELIADETIAEAIHDYYLHEEKASNASIEIINIIKKRLGDENENM